MTYTEEERKKGKMLEARRFDLKIYSLVYLLYGKEL